MSRRLINLFALIICSSTLSAASITPFSPIRSIPAFGSQTQPAIASNGKTRLVAWIDNRSTIDRGANTRSSLKFARIDATGNVLDPFGVTITDDGINTTPDVAWTGTRFVITWTHRQGNDDAVYAATVTDDLAMPPARRIAGTIPETDTNFALVAGNLSQTLVLQLGAAYGLNAQRTARAFLLDDYLRPLATATIPLPEGVVPFRTRLVATSNDYRILFVSANASTIVTLDARTAQARGAITIPNVKPVSSADIAADGDDNVLATTTSDGSLTITKVTPSGTLIATKEIYSDSEKPAMNVSVGVTTDAIVAACQIQVAMVPCFPICDPGIYDVVRFTTDHALQSSSQETLSDAEASGSAFWPRVAAFGSDATTTWFDALAVKARLTTVSNVVVSQSAPAQFDGAVASGGQNVFATAVEPDETSPDATISVSISRAAAEAPLVVPIARADQSFTSADVAALDGGALVVWLGGTYAHRAILGRAVGADGELGPVFTIEENDGWLTSPRVLSDGSSLLIAWLWRNEIRAARIGRDGSVVIPPTTAVKTAGATDAFAFATSGNRVGFIWRDYVDGGVQVRAAVTDAEFSSQPATVSLASATATDLSLAGGAGTFAATWRQTTATTSTIALARFDTNATPLDYTPKLMSSLGDRQYSPRIAWRGAQFELLWSEDDGMVNAIRSVRFNANDSPAYIATLIPRILAPGREVRLDDVAGDGNELLFIYRRLAPEAGDVSRAYIWRELAARARPIGRH